MEIRVCFNRHHHYKYIATFHGVGFCGVAQVWQPVAAEKLVAGGKPAGKDSSVFREPFATRSGGAGLQLPASVAGNIGKDEVPLVECQQ